MSPGLMSQLTLYLRKHKSDHIIPLFLTFQCIPVHVGKEQIRFFPKFIKHLPGLVLLAQFLELIPSLVPSLSVLWRQWPTFFSWSFSSQMLFLSIGLNVFVSSICDTLTPVHVICFLDSFRSLPKCHLLKKSFPDCFT